LALGQLGPPELSKLLYEAHLLKLNYGALAAVMERPATEIWETGTSSVTTKTYLPETIEIGAVAAWLFSNEEHGCRIK